MPAEKKSAPQTADHPGEELVLPVHGVCTARNAFTLVVHGGAQMTDDPRTLQSEWLASLLRDGAKHLAAGATALDTATWVVARMEASGLFNAGRGAIPDADGIRELDAAIMDGLTHKAGAVASVVDVPSPIAAARWVMDHTDNVLLVGPSAEKALGLPVGSRAPRTAAAAPKGDHPWGTVGAVVLDRCGNLAAGTSTGGWGTKLPGRVGDSPIIGAGTYADNATAAVSATGHGEYFMRYVLAYDLHARMAYRGVGVEDAANQVIHDVLTQAGGEGGVIAVDRNGHYAWPFNSKGMLRGAVTDKTEPVLAVN